MQLIMSTYNYIAIIQSDISQILYFQKNLQDKSTIAHNLLEHAKSLVNLADNTTSFLPRYFYDLRASHTLKKTKKAQDTSEEAAYKLAAAAILAKRHLDLTKSYLMLDQSLSKDVTDAIIDFEEKLNEYDDLINDPKVYDSKRIDFMKNQIQKITLQEIQKIVSQE